MNKENTELQTIIQISVFYFENFGECFMLIIIQSLFQGF